MYGLMETPLFQDLERLEMDTGENVWEMTLEQVVRMLFAIGYI